MKYQFHPITARWRDMLPDERQRLENNMREHGFDPRFPIAVWAGHIVDGRHRELIAAALGIEPVYRVLDDDYPSEADMIRFVETANWHRRADTTPITNAAKRARTEAAWRANPSATVREIAAQAGASHDTAATVRRDMETSGALSESDNVARPAKTDTLGRKASPGRPRRGPKLPQTETLRSTIRNHLLTGEPIDRKALTEQFGVSMQPLKTAEAFERGRLAAEAEPTIARSDLSLTAQQKLDAAIRQHKKALDAAFETRVRSEYVDRIGEWLADARKREAHYNLVIKARAGFMKFADYQLIERCLHPDNSASAEVRARAFDMWRQLKRVLVRESESPADLPPPLPASVDELLKMKQAATAARKKAREQRSVPAV